MLNFYTYEKLRPPLPPLPECEGPRLEPFSVEDDVDIEFISPIASGGHAVLWQVAIQGRVYALKMVSTPHASLFASTVPKFRLILCSTVQESGPRRIPSFFPVGGVSTPAA